MGLRGLLGLRVGVDDGGGRGGDMVVLVPPVGVGIDRKFYSKMLDAWERIGLPVELHALDPLSRVDLELPEHEMATRWPRTRDAARGAAVTLEAGDVLVMPQVRAKSSQVVPQEAGAS